MTTPFDKYWVEKHGGPPEPGQHGMFEEAKRAWDASSPSTMDAYNKQAVMIQELSELEEVLRGQLRALLVERDEFERKSQRHEQLRRQTEKQCERLQKRIQDLSLHTVKAIMKGVADAFSVGPGKVDPKTIADVCEEVGRARKKFPSNQHLLAALGEEYGELCEAFLENQGKDRVYSEAKQVACVAIRIMEEGDSDFDE